MNAPMTTTTTRAAATTTHAQRRKPYVNMPAQAGDVSLDAQGFLRLILDVSAWVGYTTISVKALAKRADISRAQAFRFMKELTDAKLVARVWVDGEYRTYHADGFGVLPPEERITTEAPAHPPRRAPEPRRTITTAPTALRPKMSNVNVALPPQETIRPEPAMALVEPEPIPKALVEPEPPADGIDTEFNGFTVPELEA